VDGDGIPYRTRPGDHPRGAYFTRGSGHDSHARYTEDAEAYREVVDRIARKIDSAATALPEPEIRRVRGATCGIVTLGGCRAAVLEAQDRLKRHGVKADVLRVRGFPFHPSVKRFLDRAPRPRLRRGAEPRRPAPRPPGHGDRGTPSKLTSLRFYGGMPLSWGPVVDGVRASSASGGPAAAPKLEVAG
jgi:2-oxoglutarate/2-oxoacid ferredoxin oxidoreductase subunit alpha